MLLMTRTMGLDHYEPVICSAVIRCYVLSLLAPVLAVLVVRIETGLGK